jgi:hypothetical protein
MCCYIKEKYQGMDIYLQEKKDMLDAITTALKGVPGVAAIVLGGSHAAGYAHKESDMDIGLYYFENSPFDIESIRHIANCFSIQGGALVTGFYEWGPWVNGGAWITTAAGKVDLIYRNIDQVQQTITDAVNGIWHHHFDQQPPYGFRSVIYLGETLVCKPLFDLDQVIQSLKAQVSPYPARLKQTILSDCLWLAEFTFMQCYHFAHAADTYNTVGCFTRIINYLVHALFALNESYPLGDKRAMQLLAVCRLSPPGIKETLDHILGHAGTQASELTANTDRLKGVWNEIVTLTEGQYTSRFKVNTA